MIEESSIKLQVRIKKPQCTGGQYGKVILEHPVGVDSVCLEFGPQFSKDGAQIALSPGGIEGLRDMLSAYLLARDAMADTPTKKETP